MRILKFVAVMTICGILCGSEAVAQQQAGSGQQQTKPSSPAGAQGQNSQAEPSAQQTPPPANPNAKVIFSRSDEDEAVEKPAKAGNAPATTAKVMDAERAAITFTAYDLDVRLAPKQHSLAVRARVEVRNDSDQPLKQLPLQLSSSLNFEDVSAEGKRLAFSQQTITSDVDHTGRLHEAVVALPSPLASKGTLKLDIFYSGVVELNATRLLQIGTPEEVAEHSDWDQIAEGFVGLRGFGDVVWYPVSSVPELLGDGAKVFTAIGGQKQRQADARIQMRVTEEFFGNPPTVAILAGHQVEMDKPTAMSTDEYPGVITASLAATRLGFAVPTLFVAERALREGDGVRVYAQSQNQANAQGFLTAATMVEPLVQQWLGAKAKAPLTVLDLPEADDSPFEQGNVLLTGMNADPPEKLTEGMSHALAHSYFQSPREWLNEGVANFVATLWTEHMHDRSLALEQLEASRGGLTFAEPPSPGETGGEDLIHASDAVFYRAKATYVLWMLRDVAGDGPLAAALHKYDAAADTSPDYFEHLLEQASGKNLKWFFDSWVYRDRGLPDLSIVAVHPSPAAHEGQVLVAIDMANDGFAEVEVPVTVRSRKTTLTERVRLPGKTKTTHRMLIEGEPVEVILNDGTVPEVAASIHRHMMDE